MQINEEEFVDDIKRFVSENVSLSKISDEELAERIDQIVTDRLKDIYCPIETKVSISQQVYSSIRGFGLLDSIISDDSITEVMINGPEKIFIEKKGRLTRLDKKFESQRKLEDVIQRIVGLAGREVNQANPICDTRLPDGSRVNVVLPPIALCGPTITIRKFSKEPMTINKLIEYGSITIFLLVVVQAPEKQHFLMLFPILFLRMKELLQLRIQQSFRLQELIIWLVWRLEMQMLQVPGRLQ